MKSFTKILSVIAVLLFFSPGSDILSQMRHGGGVHPDSLSIATLSGTAIVVDTAGHTIYFLDEDGDGAADYHLNFGPFWYHPDSSDAVRPHNGDAITVTGGLFSNRRFDFQTLVVFKINGKYWRRPFEGRWHKWRRHWHRFRNIDSLVTVSLNGTALVDKTFFMNRYFIDTDGDSLPNYFLNFGPPWYHPESGAVRPAAGEQISITGGTFNSDREMQMVLVYKINGLTWRDSSRFGRHFGGGWMHRNMSGAMNFYTPFDNEDVFTVHSGWADGGMGGGMMFPDSLFCEFDEVYPEEMPDVNAFAGYEISLTKPDGQDMMSGSMGKSINFSADSDYRLHYTDEQLDLYNVNETTIKVKMWDEQADGWEIIPASLDAQNNVVTFSTSKVSGLIALTADNLTAVNPDNEIIPAEFSLSQNYPNPFNPSTLINFKLSKDSHVTLSVFNILGEKVLDLVNEFRSAGNYTVNFNASELNSGIYFYRLSDGTKTLVRKMSLIK